MYLIDTDICSYAITRHPRVLDHWRNRRLPDLLISAITEAELRFGAVNSPTSRLGTDLDVFLKPYEIVEFSTAHVAAYAELRLALKRRGTPIGDLDMLIAAQAVALDLTLVTNNEREFRRVPGLKIENWAT